MRFALLGTHPDGIAFVCALVDSGRHQLLAYTSANEIPADLKQRWGETAQRRHDLEDILADPAIEAVVVAGTLDNRPTQLRRSLQSGRHVVCIHPADGTPELAYEASLLREDTGCVLVPLLGEALHPAIARLRALTGPAPAPLGMRTLLRSERAAVGPVVIATGPDGKMPCFPGWDVLRALGGEIAEVMALAAETKSEAPGPLVLGGRFITQGLFESTFLPNQTRDTCRWVVNAERGRAELTFPQGLAGPAFLGWQSDGTPWQEEAWDAWSPWPRLVEALEEAVAACGTTPSPRGILSWNDAVRVLELDDAARRSADKRRASTLDYQEVSEEVGFKGTMTLAGCGVLWFLILVVILANWIPWIGWVVVPLLALFLGLQLLRWIVPRPRE